MPKRQPPLPEQDKMDPENENEAVISVSKKILGNEAEQPKPETKTVEETPKAPEQEKTPAVEVSKKTREKYGELSTDELLAEIEKWTTHSRTNENHARENRESLNTVKTDLENLQEKYDATATELAELKLANEKHVVSSTREKALLKAGLDVDEFSEYITATEEAEIERQVSKLADRIGGPAPAKETKQKNVITNAGTPNTPGATPLGSRLRAALSGN